VGVQQAMADFAAVGDVVGTVNEAGGATGALIIGNDGTGGLLADGAAPFIGTLATLESSSVIIGNQPGSIGAANIEDFINGGNWEITGDLVVGNAGLGFLDFLNAGTIGDAPTSTITGNVYVGGGFGSTAPSLDPNHELGEGVIRVNGLGSRLATGELSVGGQGVGVIQISGRSSLITNLEATIGSAIGSPFETGDGTVELTDLGSRWTAKAPVSVGGLAGASHGKVVISNQAVFQLESALATLTINPRGRLELAGGTLRMLPKALNVVANNGIISGDGFIDGGIDIGATGELRNATGERLVVAELVTNFGTIQSLGGVMEFEDVVDNNLEIIARDAEIHFRAGVDNNFGGIITIGGNTTIHGTVNNVNGGDIIVLSGSESTIVGDLTFTGNSILSLTAGPAAGTLDVTGDILFDTTAIDINYSAGVLPNPGDTYQILQAGGDLDPLLGGFSPTAIDDEGRLWNISQSGNALFATFATASPLLIGADFNGDGVVDAFDLGIWQANYPIASGAGPGVGDADGDGDVDGDDFLKIQRDFGIIPVPPIVALAASSTAVPEPSTLALALLTLGLCPRKRR
jgi:T5SS/PEP-CTERM-associated repeat protein